MASYESRYGKPRSRTCYWPRRENKAKRAQALLDERAKRSTQEQWERLDYMFGIGQGATKERKRLFKLLPAVDQLMAATEGPNG